MALDRGRLLLAAGALACLGLAGYEARDLSRRTAAPNPCEGKAQASTIEASFRPILEAEGEGRREEALLLLLERGAKGPYPGFAWFLLGKNAFLEGEYGSALRHYRRAVEADPAVADRGAAFGAAKLIREQLGRLRASEGALRSSEEKDDYYYLERRLSGGCE